MAWSFVIHIVGFVLWLGGLLVACRVAKLLATGEAPPQEAVVTTLRKIWSVNVLQGLALTLFTGVYQLFVGGIGTYMKQGWFHGKLTLVLILIAATVFLGLEVRRVGEGSPANPGRLKLVQILGIISLIGIVALTKALRF